MTKLGNYWRQHHSSRSYALVPKNHARLLDLQRGDSHCDKRMTNWWYCRRISNFRQLNPSFVIHHIRISPAGRTNYARAIHIQNPSIRHFDVFDRLPGEERKPRKLYKVVTGPESHFGPGQIEPVPLGTLPSRCVYYLPNEPLFQGRPV